MPGEFGDDWEPWRYGNVQPVRARNRSSPYLVEAVPSVNGAQRVNDASSPGRARFEALTHGTSPVRLLACREKTKRSAIRSDNLGPRPDRPRDPAPIGPSEKPRWWL